MNTKNYIDKLQSTFRHETFEEELAFETEMIVAAFLSEIEKAADEQGIKRKELAEKIGTSASYITQIMKGNKIPNLKTLTALGLAVGRKFDVRAVVSVQESRKDLGNVKPYKTPNEDKVFAFQDKAD